MLSKVGTDVIVYESLKVWGDVHLLFESIFANQKSPNEKGIRFKKNILNLQTFLNLLNPSNLSNASKLSNSLKRIPSNQRIMV